MLSIIIAFFVLGIAFYAGFNDKNYVMITAFLAFIVLLFINYLDKISEIQASASGIVIKAREVISDAQVTIKELRNLAKSLIKTVLSFLLRSWGYSTVHVEESKDFLLKSLDQLGISKTEQEELLDSEWNKHIIAKYVAGILGGVDKTPMTFSVEERMEWKDLERYKLDNPLTPDEIQGYLIKWGALSPDRKELIDDYRFFIKYKKHRRIDVWYNYGKWGELKKQTEDNTNDNK